MKYVSNIVAVPEGRVSSLLLRTWRPDNQLAITVHDTETGEDTVVGCSKIERIDVVGFGRNVTFDGCALVRHDIKTAALYKYVAKCESHGGVGRIDFDGSDLIELGAGGELDFTWVNHKKGLVIDTGNDIFSVRGELGSVIVKFWASENRIDCYSLYDFLAILCRRLNINVLKYHTIQLYSKAGNYTLTIRLMHTQEAERYFTKMYVDISGVQL